MTEITTGAGLGALGFWLFVAAIIVVGVWDKIRKRDAQHETLRRVIESGQPIDEVLTDKLLQITGGSDQLERDMMVAGVIMLALAPALVLFGWLLSVVAGDVMIRVMLAVAALVAVLGVGFLVVARIVRRYEAQRLID